MNADRTRMVVGAIKMTAVILLLCLLQATTLVADEPPRPSHYTFAVMSPHRQFYCVQTLHSWDLKMNMKGRFQVFETSSGKLKWQSDTILAPVGEVYIPDDPDYVVVLHYWTDAKGASGSPVVCLAGVSVEGQKAVLEQTALKFYKRHSLLKQHSLEALKVPPTKLVLSASHVQFYGANYSTASQHWQWPDDGISKVTNPSFDNSSHTFRLEVFGGLVHRFDYKTGNLIRTEVVGRTATEDASKR